MKERPIIFSAPMVRAILEGRKTQTRRVVKPQPRTRADIGHFGAGMPFIRAASKPVRCPYGQPGDRLWVRETCAIRSIGGAVKDSIHYAATPELGRFLQSDMRTFADSKPPPFQGRWTPSIHMPRWASRINLEVTGVRVEQLSGVKEADCWAEGIERSTESPTQASTMFSDYAHPRCAFMHLWEQINGAGSWNANPWVWAIEFQRVMS